MISVVSVSPANNATGVLRDVVIEILFSEEVSNTFLTSDYFKLYIQPGWVGTINTSITKDPGNSLKIKLVPSIKLNPNTAYSVWVMGDKNITDLNIQGITSITSQVMNGHYIANFTTGDKLSTEINLAAQVGGYSPVSTRGSPGTNIILTPAEQAAIYSSNELLDVIRTSPEDGSINISGLVNMSVTFDAPIVAYGIASDIVEITAYHYIFGNPVTIPGIISVVPSSNKLLITTDGLYSTNTEYTVTVRRETISGLPCGALTEGLALDVVFTFASPIYPSCVDIRTIRHRGQGLVPSSIPDTVINRYILDASIWALETLGVTLSGNVCCPSELAGLVTCKTIQDIATAISIGGLRGIKEKELGDLRIAYDRQGIQDQLNGIQDCINEALSLLGVDLGTTGIGIKSFGSLIRPYVGAKRHIHKYQTGRRSWT